MSNHPPERYFVHLEKFTDKLQNSVQQQLSQSSYPLGKLIYHNDGRTPFFQLQGLARIEVKAGKNRKQAEGWLIEFKKIEDALGKYDYWHTMKEKNSVWKFPAEVEQFFEQQAHFHLGVLEERLISQGWITHNNDGYQYSEKAIKHYKKNMKNQEWYNPIKESKKLAKLLRDEAYEIHEKITNKSIDLNELESGVHEFRRKLRWLGIYSSCLMGKIQFSNAEQSEKLSHYITNERKSYKFNQLPSSKKIESPVSFLRGGFYAMSEIISAIGDIKDPGLATEEMLKVGQLFGINKVKVIELLGNDYYPHDKVIKDAKEIIEKYLFKELILIHIADHFDKQT